MQSARPGRGQVLANFVGGKHRASQDGRTTDVVDPSTGEAYLQAPVSGPADVDAALQAAAEAFETWRDTTPAERSLALLRFADAIEARAEDLIEAEPIGGLSLKGFLRPVAVWSVLGFKEGAARV